MERRIGVVGIVIENTEVIGKVNSILHDYAEIIVGRMGVPYRQRKVRVISLIIEGTTDEIGALTGKIGNLPGVSVKSALSKC